MDLGRYWEQTMSEVVDLYDQASIYFDSLGQYGLIGWALVIVGLILLTVGSILLAA